MISDTCEWLLALFLLYVPGYQENDNFHWNDRGIVNVLLSDRVCLYIELEADRTGIRLNHLDNPAYWKTLGKQEWSHSRVYWLEIVRGRRIGKWDALDPYNHYRPRPNNGSTEAYYPT